MTSVQRLVMASRVAKSEAEKAGVNPFLNTPATELARMLPEAKGKRRKLIQRALAAWRSTTLFGAGDGSVSKGSQTPDPANGKQAARPIPLDKPTIRREVDQAVRATMDVLSSLPPNQPVGTQRVYMNPLSLRDPRGKPMEVYLVIGSQPGRGKDLTLGAGFSRLPIGSAVVFQLNGGLTPVEFKVRERELKQDLWRQLIHELTHALDLTRGQESGGLDPKTVDEWVRYFNLPREVRAYMQEIVDQVLQTVPRGSSSQADQSLINRALMQSRTWQEIGNLFNPANRKKILQAVFAAVSEVLSMGKAAKMVTTSLGTRDY